jgi:hypothetical protein
LGNVYLIGDSYSTSTFDDVMIRKYDTTGKLLWNRQISSTGFDFGLGVVVDRLGNIFVAGDTDGNIVGTGHGWDSFVAKYDAAGNQQWLRQFGAEGEDGAFGVTADGLGNVFVGGRTNGETGGPNAGFYDAFITKLDNSGTIQWTRQFGTEGYDESGYMWADQFGNLYATGTTYGNLDGPNNSGADVFVRKFDPLGNLMWSTQLGTQAPDFGLGLSGDGLGNIYLTGATYGNLGGTNTGGGAALLIKFNVPEPSGVLLATIPAFFPIRRHERRVS